jgi:sulfur carrier protein ThiS
MKVNVKLFSVLRDCVPGYNPQTGVDADLADGTTVADMLGQLGIPMSKAPVVTCKGRILHPGDAIQNESTIEIFQPVAGG